MTRNRTATICLSIFALFLAVYAVNAFFNYSASFVDDILIYLRSAKALLAGKFTIDYPVYHLLKSHFSDMNNTLVPFVLNPEGKLVSVVSVGIAMVFAPFVALFGDNTIWLAPIVWDLCLLVCLFFVVRIFFKNIDAPHAWILALLAVAAYGTVINFRLNLRRDIACASLASIATLLTILGGQKKRYRYWYAAFGLLCFITTIKVVQAMLFVPFLLYIVNVVKIRSLDKKTVVTGAAFVLGIGLVVFTPFFLQNHATSGHWYWPAQLTSMYAAPPPQNTSHLASKALSAFVDLCRAQSYIYSPKGLSKWCALPFIALAAFGAWAFRKNVFVRWWVIPFVGLEYAFMLVWMIPYRDFAYTYNIYLSPAYPMAVFLFVCGAYEFLRRFRNKTALLWVTAAVVLVPFFGVKAFRSLPDSHHVRFRLPEVRRLTADLERVVPPKSVLLCDRFLCFTIDYFSDLYCFPPKRLDDSTSAIIGKVAYLLEKKVPVYFCDYRGIEGSYTYREKLEKTFTLSVVKKDQCLYNYPSVFPAPPFSIFRVDEKRHE
jgi:Dolichyl-phosphate-mannose-protein mannosyltransferase